MLNKILIVTSEFPPLPGGIGNHAYNLAEYLQKEDYQVNVLTDQRTKDIEEKEFDASLKAEIYRVSLKNIRSIMYFNRLILLIKLLRSAEIIIASGKFSLWAVALCSVVYKRKYIAVIHGTEVNFSNVILKAFINKSLKQFHAIIAVSRYTKSLIKYLNLKKVEVIPNGLSIKESKNEKTESRIQLKGFPKLLTVGNVTQRKGQLQVIEHLPELIKVFPKIHYHCVGYNTETEMFLKQVRSLGLENHITFHGRVTYEDLNQFYKDSDVFVMLSGQSSCGDVEGFGIAILEANYFGLAAIGATDCGIEDAIDNKRSGILINRTNSKEFIDAITAILDEKFSFKTKAKSWALNHDWKIIIQDYIKVIQS